MLFISVKIIWPTINIKYLSIAEREREREREREKERERERELPLAIKGPRDGPAT